MHWKGSSKFSLVITKEVIMIPDEWETIQHLCTSATTDRKAQMITDTITKINVHDGKILATPHTSSNKVLSNTPVPGKKRAVDETLLSFRRICK